MQYTVGLQSVFYCTVFCNVTSCIVVKRNNISEALEGIINVNFFLVHDWKLYCREPGERGLDFHQTMPR